MFNHNDGYKDLPVEVPCGRCIGCRLERSRQWAVRCLNEASLHEDNCFITLTYDDEHIPSDNSLNKEHHQKFMKRLRFKYRQKKIRFFHCGEYGDESDRPHYHTLLFNHDFEDKELYADRESGRHYVSESLNKLWPYGFSVIGDVTFESAAYVARYCLKKINGDDAEEHYKSLNPYTGELTQIEPEYCNMSLKPGIGQGWFSQFAEDIYPDDFQVVRGQKMKPPKYYNGLLEKLDETMHEAVRLKRLEFAKKNSSENTPQRLAVREKVAKAKLTKGRNL